MVFAVNGYCQDAASSPKEFGGIVTDVTSMAAMVEAVDSATREVTLKGSDGQEVTVVAGPEVRNFDQIKKGDTLTVDYSESVKILVNKEAVAPVRVDSMDVSRAPLGAKPAGVITSSTQVSATVEAIDYANRTATLKGPQRTVTVKVDESAVNFDQVKVGDSVYLEITSRLAVSVTK